jgi:hypothetical protein
MSRFITLAATILIALGVHQPLYALPFANQFIAFELPAGWQCNLEAAEWICQNTNPAKQKDAIIILAAKIKGDQDSLDQYLSYLQSPKTYQAISGKTVKSEAKYAKYAKIGEQNWVDSLHLESEIPGYYTRYLATIKADIAVLVTFSIVQSKYAEYQGLFESLVQSLQVFRRQGSLNVQGSDTPIFQTTKVPSHLNSNSIFTDAAQEGSEKKSKSTANPLDDLYFYGGAAAVALVIMLIVRARRKNG